MTGSRFQRNVNQQVVESVHRLPIDRHDDIWITDKGSDMVVRFDPAGRVKMVFGRKPEASNEEAHALAREHASQPDRALARGAGLLRLEAPTAVVMRDGRTREIERLIQLLESVGREGRSHTGCNCCLPQVLWLSLRSRLALHRARLL